jgi:hypothetical protein
MQEPRSFEEFARHLRAVEARDQNDSGPDFPRADYEGELSSSHRLGSAGRS